VAKSLTNENEFSLYAISTRFPQALRKSTTLIQLQPGIYELDLTIKIRLIVLNKIPKSRHNVIWHLFSHISDKVSYASKHYQSKIHLSSAVNSLYEHYNLEGLIMPYTVENFKQDYAKEHLHCLNTAQRLEGLSTSEIVSQISTSEIVNQIPTDELLKELSEEEIMSYLLKLKKTKH